MLNVSRVLITIVQHGSKGNAECGPVVKLMVQKNLIAPKISLFDCDKNSVVDCDNWRLLPRAPQIKLNHRNVRAWKEVHEKGYPRA